MSDLTSLVTQRLEGSLAAINSLRGQIEPLAALADVLVERLRAGATVYTAGNGGSAAQAMHLAEELIGRYRGDRRPWPAVCLNADPTALTCIANDFGYEAVFARQCEALLRKGDVLVVFSTSGNSLNLVRALETARNKAAITVGLLGRAGGACAQHCDHAVIVAAAVSDSAHIQEAHQVMLHILCEAVERASF